MGPWIVTADEVGDPHSLEIESRVNGEVRQHSNTSHMIFDIPKIISSLSAGLTLEPGDVIATGTCAGVGMGFDPPRLLSPGDVVEAEVSAVGVLRTTIGPRA
jgi:2-keto-4-pentenoate hydratase/2-oxohepta-3-ene-1,7-dioic acid hydratase in catechol pathway